MEKLLQRLATCLMVAAVLFVPCNPIFSEELNFKLDIDRIIPQLEPVLIHKGLTLSLKEKNFKKVCASWYGKEHHNKLTASGQRFDMYGNTLAHKTLPLGTKVLIVNYSNGKSVRATINDRGPYIKGRDIDVSFGVAEKLGFVNKGVATLHMEII